MLKKVICIFIEKLYVASRSPKTKGKVGRNPALSQTLLLADIGRVDMRCIAFQHELSSQLPGSDCMGQEFSGEIHTGENLKANLKAIGLLFER